MLMTRGDESNIAVGRTAAPPESGSGSREGGNTPGHKHALWNRKGATPRTNPWFAGT